MSSYSDALKAYLDKAENKVTDLAAAVQTFQPNITRWKEGDRFPSAEMARRIDAATDGEVPFAIWQADFMRKAGIESPIDQARDAA